MEKKSQPTYLRQKRYLKKTIVLTLFITKPSDDPLLGNDYEKVI